MFLNSSTSKEIMKKRDSHIDFLKGIAIILVILGHSIQYSYPNTFDQNIAFRIIYSFHMPLFMFLSGYVSYNHLRGNFISFFVKKFKALMLPFLSSYFVINYLLLRRYRTISFENYSINLINSPDNGLWFLWVLFVCTLIIWCTSKLNRKLEDIALLVIEILMYQYLPILIPSYKYGIGLIIWHFPFVVSGYLFSKYRLKLVNISTVVKELSLIGFPMLVIDWHRFNPTIPKFIITMIKSIGLIEVNTSFNYLVAFLGIGFIWNISKSLERYKQISFISWLGMYTKDIYILQSYFIFIFGQNILNIITTSVITTILSILVSFYIIRQSKIMKFLILGT